MIILGGAARTGKGLLCQRLISRTGLPCLSTDPVKMALSRCIPAYPLNTDGSSIEVSEQLWPFISALISNQIETRATGIIEGEILPKQVAELQRKHPQCIRACFVGYADLSVDKKYHQVRKHSGHPNDWTASLSESELRQLIRHSIQFSQYLQQECRTLNLTYIDFSADFETGARQVLTHLTGTGHSH